MINCSKRRLRLFQTIRLSTWFERSICYHDGTENRASGNVSHSNPPIMLAAKRGIFFMLKSFGICTTPEFMETSARKQQSSGHARSVDSKRYADGIQTPLPR